MHDEPAVAARTDQALAEQTAELFGEPVHVFVAHPDGTRQLVAIDWPARRIQPNRAVKCPPLYRKAPYKTDFL